MKKLWLAAGTLAVLAAAGYVWHRSLPTPLEKGRQALAKGDASLAVEILAGALDGKSRDSQVEHEMRSELARGYMLKGDFDNAEDQFRQILEKTPRDFSAHLGLGFVSYARGYEAYARDAFLEAKRSDPEDVRAPLALASLYTEQREFERAKQEFLEILARDPSNRLAREGLAETLLIEGAFHEAVVELELVLENFPKEESARLHLIRAYFGAGQVARAEQELRARMKEGKNDAATRRRWAEILQATAHWEQARDVYQKLRNENPRDIMAGLRLAICQARLGETAKAREILEQLELSISLLQESSLSFSTLYEAWDTFKARHQLKAIKMELLFAWHAFYVFQALYPEADKEIERALQIDGKNLEALRLKAELHRLRREPKERLAQLNQAAEIYPRHPEVKLDRADALLALKKFDEAQRDILDVRAGVPSLARAAATLSRALLLRAKTKEARSAAEEALSLDPGNSDAHLALGLVHTAERRWAAAEESFRNAIKFDAFNARAHHELGLVLKARKKTEKARAAFRQASSLEPFLYPFP